jgi:AraC-like DNA-binding protein
MTAFRPTSPNLPIRLSDFTRLFGLRNDLDLMEDLSFAEPVDDDETIGLADCFRFLRRMRFAGGDETFALSSRPLFSGTGEFILSRAAGAETLGGAMRQIASAYNLLHGADYNRVEHRADQFIYALHDENFPYTRPRDDYLHFSLECTLVFIHAVICELAQQDLSARVRRVSTKRSNRTGPGASGLGFWRAPICYGAAIYGVAYDSEVDDLPVLGLRPGLAADLAVHNRILSLIEGARDDGADKRLATQVRGALQAGASDQEAVARGLGLSVATLRRRLAEEQTSFRSERQSVMNDYARTRILETRDIGTVAEELGFSDPRAFTRAFKAWNGLTPSDYRANPPAES